MTSYRVVRGINFPSGQTDAEGKVIETRLEPGAVATDEDLKGGNVPWFLEVGAIEEVVEPPKSAAGPRRGATVTESKG